MTTKKCAVSVLEACPSSASRSRSASRLRSASTFAAHNPLLFTIGLSAPLLCCGLKWFPKPYSLLVAVCAPGLTLQEEEFQRRPSEEVALGKREGVQGLFEIVRNRYQKKVKAAADGPSVKVASGKGEEKRPELGESPESDEDNARTSSYDENEEVSYMESAESSTSGSGESSEGDSGHSDREEEGKIPESENADEGRLEEEEDNSTDAATSDHDE